MPLARPVTATGTRLRVVVPLPSCPSLFFPQHRTPPLTTAQVEKEPAAIQVTPLKRPLTWTGSEVEVVVPLPSWPSELSPQHRAPPFTIAQECRSPAAMAPLPPTVAPKG